jgi:hypothetical protein
MAREEAFHAEMLAEMRVTRALIFSSATVVEPVRSARVLLMLVLFLYVKQPAVVDRYCWYDMIVVAVVRLACDVTKKLSATKRLIGVGILRRCWDCVVEEPS